MDFDLILSGGSVLDGSGAAAFCADIGVSDGRIAAVGDLSGAFAKTVLDTSGYTITPGFIDIHRHADWAAFRPGFGSAELAQGITSIVNGNCGLSAAPFGEAHRSELLTSLTPILGDPPEHIPSETFTDYTSALPELPLNLFTQVGLGVIRTDCCGMSSTPLSRSDICSIRMRLTRALDEGACGVSMGLGYPPESYHTTDDLTRLLSPLAHTDIPVTVHMWNEGDGMLRGVREMIRLAETLDCRVHISHLKAIGQRNWRKAIPEALVLIEEANRRGVRVDMDAYPYTAGSTQLMHILPPEFHDGGVRKLIDRLADPRQRKVLAKRLESGTDFENIVSLVGWEGIVLTSLPRPEHQRFVGKNMAEIAEMLHRSPLDAACDLLISGECRITMIDFFACEEDVSDILRHPLSCLISDAIYPTSGMPHPRLYGSFTRMIETYVLQRKLLPLEEAVRKMTSLPASVMRLKRKGLIREGMDADLCVFRPEELHEQASYTDPCRTSTGMMAVIAGGQIAAPLRR